MVELDRDLVILGFHGRRWILNVENISKPPENINIKSIYDIILYILNKPGKMMT